MDHRVERAKLIENAVTQLLSNRPRGWVVRETGLTSREVNDVARILGFKPWEGVLKNWHLETYDAVERAVAEEWSLSEIMRTYGVDHGAVKRWFPDAGWRQGGSSEGNLVREGDDRIKKAMKERGVLA